MIGNYLLAKVNLVRAGCPANLGASVANLAAAAPIIIECNKAKIGYVESTGYCPPAIVMSGEARRLNLLREGVVKAYAYVEAGSLPVKPEEHISAAGFLRKLQAQAIQRILHSDRIMAGQEWPKITEVYPFQSHFVFSMRGRQYRQHFQLGEDGIELGTITACQMRMAPVQTGVRMAYAPVIPQPNVISLGAPNSELVTQIVRNTGNVILAVQGYLDAIKFGQYKPMRPMFDPANVYNQYASNTVLAPVIKAGVDPYCFAIFSAERKGKKKKIKATPASLSYGVPAQPVPGGRLS